MKRILKKILIIVLIILLLNNFVTTSVHANAVVDAMGGAIGGLFSGVIGILTYLYRAPAVILGWLINTFMTTLAYAEGTTDPDAGGFLDFITVFDVLFTKPKIIDINFFDIKDGDNSLVNLFRINVAAWFYIMRNVSAGILLVILVYIGIRMAISTVASDRAMYKRMLVDWVVSLLLIFILNYIIIFTIEINNAIVKAMAAGQTSNNELASTMFNFGMKGLNPFGGIPSIVAAIIYIMLIWQTMALFFSYFNRMLKVAFLIIIAPLISLTYSIDKIGDGKAQALDAWLKEFVFTILIQPFHCAIYMSLISTAVNILTKRGAFNEISQTLGAGIMAIVCILFTREAEKIVRKIFGFKDDNKGTSLVAGAMLTSTALNKAKNFGEGTAKFAQGTKNFLKNTPDALRWTNIKAEAKAAGAYLSGKDLEGNASDKDYATLRSESRAKEFDKKATKWENELAEANKGKDASEKLMNAALIAEKERLKADNPGMSEEELKAVSRFNVSKRSLQDSSLPFKNGVHLIRSSKRAIRSVTSAPGKVLKSAGRLSDKLPFAETRGLMFEEVKKAPGFLVGAGVLGTTGKLSSAGASYTAANKFVEGVSKNSKGSIIKDLEKAMSGHSAEKKVELLNKVRNNPEYYALDEETVPDHLKKLIEELKKEGTTDLSENQIVNTIMSNPKDNTKALEKLGISSDTEAGKKILDYGREYSINQALGKASEIGINTGDIIRAVGNMTYDKEEVNDKKEEVNNKKIANEFDRSVGKDGDRHYKAVSEYVENIVNSSDTESKAPTEEIVKRLESLDIELEQVLKDRKNINASEEYKKKTAELERKRALLIGKAVTEIQNENDTAVEALRTKIINEITELLKPTYDEDDRDELQKLKESLENIGKQNS